MNDKWIQWMIVVTPMWLDGIADATLHIGGVAGFIAGGITGLISMGFYLYFNQKNKNI